MALLDAGFLKRLAALTLSSKRRGAGVRAGERKSIRRGRSQEFADHRPYVPGDDLRFLDWHMYGRFDSLWVKLFEEEEDRVVQMLMDTSASMEGEKLEYAQKVAAAIAFVALGHSDRVTLGALTDTLAAYCPPRRGRSQTSAIFTALQDLKADGNTDLTAAVNAFPRQRGEAIGLLFSDFLTEDGVENVLRRLRTRVGQVHVFHVISPAELDPDLVGDVQLVDRETGRIMTVSLDDKAAARYRATVQSWLAEVETDCRRLGAGYSRLLTSVPVEELVLRDLRRQGVFG